MVNSKTKNDAAGLNSKEIKDARRRSAPTAGVVYEAIRREGEEELERSTAALVWSGLAAGLSMGFSFLMEGLLSLHIPEADWKPLVTKFGYCMGFLIVILGRQQLFTENTLTPVLHLLHCRNLHTLMQTARLWGTVLAANLAGAAIFAMLMHATGYFQSDLQVELAAIAAKANASGFVATALSGLFAGWLIALMLWLLPFAETGRVTIIILVTYVIGLGQFAHIIAGSVSAFYVLMAGETSLVLFLTRFLVPTLLGNIVGGVAFVAAINHAQVDPDSCRDEEIVEG
jgi:formate/nitrite transporter FocA (FNT family)